MYSRYYRFLTDPFRQSLLPNLLMFLKHPSSLGIGEIAFNKSAWNLRQMTSNSVRSSKSMKELELKGERNLMREQMSFKSEISCVK